MYLLQPAFSAHAIVGGILSVVAPVSGEALEQASRPAHIEWRTGAVPVGAKSKAQIREAIAALRARGTGRHFVVAFDAPLTPAERTVLREAGLRLLSYLGSNAFFASLSPATLDPAAVSRVASLTDVRVIEREWKLHPALLAGEPPSWAVLGDDEENPIVAAYVVFHADVALAPEALEIAGRHGARVVSQVRSINTLVVELPLAGVAALADEDAVQWIEPPLPPLEGINDITRQITEAGIVQAPPYNLDGSGVTVLVYDGGTAEATHPDFGGRLQVRDSSPSHPHPTHVACIIGGDGAASDGLYRGMAPGVTMESYGFEDDGSDIFLYTNPGDLENDYDRAINAYGADISNNSIGTNTCSNGFPCEITGDYGVTAELIDSIVRGSLGEPFRIIWSNGNERACLRCRDDGVHTLDGYHSTAPPACAKNHITVGALGDDDSVTTFTSWGPCDDGRLKPDLSAPGETVTSCTLGGVYVSYSGTSMSGPAVAGISALLLQDFRAQFPYRDDPLNSTVKTLLAHTAADLQNEGPDYQTGYGSVRIQQAIDLMRSDNGLNFLEAPVSHGQGYPLMLQVNPGDAQLKITLAWDDLPGTPNVDPALVNDLDLRVYDPDGVQHFPWTLDPEDPGAGAVRTRADHVNNVEQVVVDSPMEGLWLAEVFGTNVPGGPQSFSVCASPRLAYDCNDNGIMDDQEIQADPGLDCASNGILDECEPDCDSDGIVNTCAIFKGISTDCNGNGIPDDCETYFDCNNNATYDACDISEGTSDDCNENWIPDECLELEEDCNTNLIPDACDLAEGTSEDCNYNEIPDECEPPEDCNDNGTLDACDIRDGTSIDCNGNSVPDECDPRATLYVDDDAPNDPGPGDPAVSDPDEDGSLEHPYDSIQEAIDAATCEEIVTDTIELADGMYYGPGNRDLDYAGRALTVRSANGPDNCEIFCMRSGRGFHFHSGEPPQARVVGLTITGGLANDGGGGGGILCKNGSSPTIANCIIEWNLADTVDAGGGGISCLFSSNPTINNCVITGNYSPGGGGIYCFYSSPTISNCVLSANSATLGEGGAALFYFSSAKIANCIIAGNTAVWNGGGIACLGVHESPTITNCSFTGNRSISGGGGAIASIGTVSTVLYNSSFTGNTAASGGAVYLELSNTVIHNSVLWGNNAPDGHEIAAVGDSMLTTRYSNIEGGEGDVHIVPIDPGYPDPVVVWGPGNIDGDPLFLDPDGIDNIIGTVDDDPRLAAGSPSNDAGDNEAVPPMVVTDLQGKARFLDDLIAPDVGNGSPPIVDMGAFECDSDCNNNGILDHEDIAAGTSLDCNANSDPDECELDTDADGEIDDCDIDDDGDGLDDLVDSCPQGQTGWTSNTETDNDGDGCRDDTEDLDDDNDGVIDLYDADPLDPDICNDADADGCDDCAIGTDGFGPLPDYDPANDGPDLDLDGVCDAGDNCDMYNPDQADCQDNGVGDLCEIADGTSEDCNGNEIPDQCELLPPGDAPASEHQAKKHRYLSVDLTSNCANSVAWKVTLVSMRRCDGLLSRACTVDDDCEASVPGSGTCVEHPDVGTGGPWWVQAPQQEQLGCLPGPCGDQDWFARVDTTPYFDTWTLSTLHIGDCEIIPVATYEIRACFPPDGTICSDPLTIGTIEQPFVSPGFRSNYGDAVGPVDAITERFTPPDGFTNVIDVSGYILTKQNYGTANKPQAHPTWVDLHGLGDGNPPQYILNVSDLGQILKAFAGDAWTDDPGNLQPGDCP